AGCEPPAIVFVAADGPNPIALVRNEAADVTLPGSGAAREDHEVSRAEAIEPGPDVLDGHPSAALFELGLDFGARSAPSVRRLLALALGPLDAPRSRRRAPLRGREVERFPRATTDASGEVLANPRPRIAPQ